MPTKGKQILRILLGSAGLEMPLNVVQLGKGMPFLHKHQQNAEVYVVIGIKSAQATLSSGLLSDRAADSAEEWLRLNVPEMSV